MSLMTMRGGIPRVWRGAIDSTGRKRQFSFYCNYLQVRLPGSPSNEPCKMYFTEDDFDNDENYVTIQLSSSDTPYGEFQGPVEISEAWFRCATSGGTSNIELVIYQRRG